MKISDGFMLQRTSPKTILQIFCKIIPAFKVIVKSVIDPEDNLPGRTLNPYAAVG